MHDLAGQIRVRYPHDMAGQIEAWKQLRRMGMIHAITGLVTTSLCVWVCALSALASLQVRPEMRDTFNSMPRAFFIPASLAAFAVFLMGLRSALDANEMLKRLRGDGS